MSFTAGSFSTPPAAGRPMTPKRKISTIVSIAAVSLLLLGITPALAQASPSQQAASAIQMAQKAQSYTNNVVSVGVNHGLDVSQAQSLISQGDQLLAKAQGEAGTNATLAAHDAVGAMKDYRSAVQNIMQEAASLFEQSQDQQVTRAQALVARLQSGTVLTQEVLTKACALPGASSATCSDANTNLATASSDLSQAATILASQNPDLSTVKSLTTDATQRLSQARQDINQLVSQGKDQAAINYVQNNLEPKISLLQGYAQKANLSSSVDQQVQSLLSNAQTDLTSAIQAFQGGNYSGGVQSAQQAVQLMQQASALIQKNAQH